MHISILLNGDEQGNREAHSNPMDLSALLNPLKESSLSTPVHSGNDMDIDDTYKSKIPCTQHPQIKTEAKLRLQHSFGSYRSVGSSSPSIQDENDTAATSPTSDWTSSFPLPQMKLEPPWKEDFKPSPTLDPVILPSMYISQPQTGNPSACYHEMKNHQYRVNTMPTSKPFKRSVMTSSVRTGPHSLLRRVKRAHREEDIHIHRLQTCPISTSLPYRSNASVLAGNEKKEMHKSPHSNKPYNPEQVYWMRYQREDCGLGWKEMLDLWHIVFPNDPRESDQCLSSRYYRDNKAPEVDEDGNPKIGPDGKAVLFAAKVRSRTTPQGKAMDVPFKFVETHPEAALKFDWVSEEHKAIARKILSGEIVESRMRKIWRRAQAMIDDEGRVIAG